MKRHDHMIHEAEPTIAVEHAAWGWGLHRHTVGLCSLLMLASTWGCTSEVSGPSGSAGIGGVSVGGIGGAASTGAEPTSSTATTSGGAGAGTTAGSTATVGTVTGGMSGPEPIDIGTKVVHRLSNTEYDNTVRDLLGTTQSFGDSFVHEEAEGFDNIAQALSMSPRQVEDYLGAARALTDSVFAEPALRDRILTCAPDAADASCAQTVISNFGLRAFRRPLAAWEAQLLVEKYQEELSLGESATDAIAQVVRIMLAAPQFLYRIEFDPNPADPAAHPLSPYELASRLSYALWSSMPDDTLFSLAASGELAQPEVLRAQVDRMLADEHSDMLVKSFAGQWLGIQRLREHVASPSFYPEWSETLAAAMQREMELYFAEFLYQDLSYTEFLTADFNFVDATLAQQYGMSSPAEPGFSRVVDTSDERLGLIGLAGFLTHTSRETRSSPIIRGKWILDAFWCLELKLPEDLVVEPLPEPAEGEAPTAVRDLIAAHRASPACAGCHSLIDPIGLALENFDGIGRYRAQYESGLSIDATGVLPSGAEVNSLGSLASAIAADPQFMSCVAEKLNTYALGRTVTDEGYFGEILQGWLAGPTTLRNLIKETVTHPTFTSRRANLP
jgi:hypothetical protein